MGAQQTTTMPLKIEEPICIAATGDVCGEGVLWERDTQSVYWTDINRFLVHRYALKDGALRPGSFLNPLPA
jgi:sugar lactone lactonase YvrE